MKRVVFEPSAFDNFTEWARVNKKLYNRIVRLIKEVQRNPFQGIGKPEPLKHDLKGYWSRRIDTEHRLVYTITDDDIIIVACKYHY